MLQLSYIRQHPEDVKERLAVKQFRQTELVDQLLAQDEEKRKLQIETENIQARSNAIAREIGQLMSSGRSEEGLSRKKEAEQLNASLKPLREKLSGIDAGIEEALISLPNLPSTQVPRGSTPEENVVVRTGGHKPVPTPGALPHWELAQKYRLVDFELGNKVTGSGFPVFTGNGARLQRSLIRYFLDFNTAAGYTEYIPPLMVNQDSAFGTGQLPDKEGQMYYVGADNLYLIPTSELPLTNLYRGEVLSEQALPVKMTAFTPCFRREAGSYGKDVRGLNRLHQFDKVEIVQLVDPRMSYEVLEEMVEHVERLVQSLALPYRILRLCGGDMSFASALTYDFEVYSGAQEKWLEVSSVSNFETFQTNRMKIRYKGAGGKPRLLHSLNGSSLALPRILAALLENNQDAGGVTLPEVLRPYYGDTIIS